MGTSDDLLRALNPAVRPVGPGSPTRNASPSVPFEKQSFDELLHAFDPQAKPETNPQPSDAGTPVAENPDATKASAGLDFGRIENASLRTIIAQRQTPSAQDLPTTS
ncbi:MAG: hypothetical protein AAGF84_10505 [Planctomycetota bacterium]